MSVPSTTPREYDPSVAHDATRDSLEEMHRNQWREIQRQSEVIASQSRVIEERRAVNLQDMNQVRSLTALTSQQGQELADATARIELLEGLNLNQFTTIEEQRRIIDILKSDIHIINDRMVNEAVDRSWCSDFDEIIRDLQTFMSQYTKLHGCTRKFAVTTTLAVEVVTFVNARTEEDARSRISPTDVVAFTRVSVPETGSWELKGTSFVEANAEEVDE